MASASEDDSSSISSTQPYQSTAQTMRPADERPMERQMSELSHPTDDPPPATMESTRGSKRKPGKVKMKIRIDSAKASTINEDTELRRQIKQTCGCPLWKLPGDYRNHEIGSGHFARVHVIDHPERPGRKVVAKVIQADAKTPRTRELFVKEMKIGNGVEHCNVVRFLAYWDCPLVVYLEYVAFSWHDYGLDQNSHNLVNLLQTMHEAGVVRNFLEESSIFETVVSDVASGLSYLHGIDVVHRDLKPLNILVSNSDTDILDGEEREIVCKITDFGESRTFFAQTASITATNTKKLERGTTPFMSPEVMNADYDGKNYDALKRIDIWAFGMIIFCLLNPDIEYPFYNEQAQAETLSKSSLDQDKFKSIMKRAFMQGKIPPKGSEIYENLAQDMPIVNTIMGRCLTNDPEGRPTASDVKEWLADPTHFKDIFGNPDDVTSVADKLNVNLRNPSSLQIQDPDNRRSKHEEDVMKELKEIRSDTKALMELEGKRRDSFSMINSDTIVAQVSEDVSDMSLDSARPITELTPRLPHQEEIQKNWKTLHDTLDPWSVVTQLFTLRLLTHTEKELVMAETSRPRQAEKLLEMIYHRDEELYTEFLRVLRQTNQSFLADRVTGEICPSTPTHVGTLTTRHMDLLRDMTDVDFITDHLFSKGLVTRVQMEGIKSKITETQKGDAVLDIVRTFSPEGFKQFAGVLSDTGNGHLALMLTQQSNDNLV